MDIPSFTVVVHENNDQIYFMKPRHELDDLWRVMCVEELRGDCESKHLHYNIPSFKEDIEFFIVRHTGCPRCGECFWEIPKFEIMKRKGSHMTVKNLIRWQYSQKNAMTSEELGNRISKVKSPHLYSLMEAEVMFCMTVDSSKCSYILNEKTWGALNLTYVPRNWTWRFHVWYKDCKIGVQDILAHPRGNVFECTPSSPFRYNLLRVILDQPNMRTRSFYLIPIKKLYDHKFIHTLTYPYGKSLLVVENPRKLRGYWTDEYLIELQKDWKSRLTHILDQVIEHDRTYL